MAIYSVLFPFSTIVPDGFLVGCHFWVPNSFRLSLQHVANIGVRHKMELVQQYLLSTEVTRIRFWWRWPWRMAKRRKRESTMTKSVRSLISSSTTSRWDWYVKKKEMVFVFNSFKAWIVLFNVPICLSLLGFHHHILESPCFLTSMRTFEVSVGSRYCVHQIVVIE